MKALFAGILILVGWTLWQSVGIEAMRLPWEDDILYTLPAVNWATGGNFSLPQLGHFMDADIGWRWHMPLFPSLAAVWVKMAGYQLTVLRLFSLLPAAFMAFLLARCCARLASQKDWPWMLFWLGVILGDKSFVMNSLNGRMEFWCLLAAIGSVTLALDSRKVSAFVVHRRSLGTGSRLSSPGALLPARFVLDVNNRRPARFRCDRFPTEARHPFHAGLWPGHSDNRSVVSG